MTRHRRTGTRESRVSAGRYRTTVARPRSSDRPWPTHRTSRAGLVVEPPPVHVHFARALCASTQWNRSPRQRRQLSRPAPSTTGSIDNTATNSSVNISKVFYPSRSWGKEFYVRHFESWIPYPCQFPARRSSIAYLKKKTAFESAEKCFFLKKKKK